MAALSGLYAESLPCASVFLKLNPSVEVQCGLCIGHLTDAVLVQCMPETNEEVHQ